MPLGRTLTITPMLLLAGCLRFGFDPITESDSGPPVDVLAEASADATPDASQHAPLCNIKWCWIYPLSHGAAVSAAAERDGQLYTVLSSGGVLRWFDPTALPESWDFVSGAPKDGSGVPGRKRIWVSPSHRVFVSAGTRLFSSDGSGSDPVEHFDTGGQEIVALHGVDDLRVYLVTVDKLHTYDVITAMTSTVSLTTGSGLNDVWGDSTTAWVVGNAGKIARVAPGVGASTDEATGTNERLNSIWGSDATAMLAVGNGNVALQRNAATQSWQSIDISLVADEDLKMVRGTAADNIIVYGTGTLSHFDGFRWRPYALPPLFQMFVARSPLPSGRSFLGNIDGNRALLEGGQRVSESLLPVHASGVTASGNDSILLSTEEGSIFETPLAAPNLTQVYAGTKRLRQIWSPDGQLAYAVGDGVILRRTAPDQPFVNITDQVGPDASQIDWVDIHGTTADHIVIVSQLHVRTFNGSSWQPPSSAPPVAKITSVWTLSPTGTYFGGDGIVRFDGTNWTVFATPPGLQVQDIWANENNVAIASTNLGTFQQASNTWVAIAELPDQGQAVHGLIDGAPYIAAVSGLWRLGDAGGLIPENPIEALRRLYVYRHVGGKIHIIGITETGGIIASR